MPAPLPTGTYVRLRCALVRFPFLRRLVSVPPASPSPADVELVGAASSGRVLDGVLAEHYVALLCADLASLRPRYSAAGVGEVVPLLLALPRPEASAAVRMVRDVYGPRAFLPFPVVRLASVVSVPSLFGALLPPGAAEVAATVLSDGFDGTLEDLVSLASLLGDPPPAGVR